MVGQDELKSSYTKDHAFSAPLPHVWESLLLSLLCSWDLLMGKLAPSTLLSYTWPACSCVSINVMTWPRGSSWWKKYDPRCMRAGWKVQRRLGLLVVNKQNVSWQIMVWKLGDLASKPYLSLVGGVIPGKLIILSESQLSWLYNGSSDARLAGVLVRTGSGLK